MTMQKSLLLRVFSSVDLTIWYMITTQTFRHANAKLLVLLVLITTSLLANLLVSNVQSIFRPACRKHHLPTSDLNRINMCTCTSRSCLLLIFLVYCASSIAYTQSSHFEGGRGATPGQAQMLLMLVNLLQLLRLSAPHISVTE